MPPYDIIITKLTCCLARAKVKVGNLVIKLVKRYWNDGDLWEVFIKNNRSIGFVRKTITRYYAVWSALLQYGKDSVEFKTKKEAVEYLVGPEE